MLNTLYRVSWEQSVHGQNVVNVLYMRQKAGTAVTAQDVASELFASLSSTWNFIQPVTNVTHRMVRTQEVTRGFNSDIGEFADVRSTTPAAVTGAALSPTLAFIVTLRTGFGGRSRRGRIYIAGAALSDASGIIDSVSITRADTFASTLVQRYGPSGSSNYELGVFSRSRFSILSNPFDEYWVRITTTSAQRIFGNQRRRRPSVGT
jgi:hypothetical protein